VTCVHNCRVDDMDKTAGKGCIDILDKEALQIRMCSYFAFCSEN